MNGLPNFYSAQFSPTDPRRSMNGYAQDENMDNLDAVTMESSMMGQPQTLDQIMNQNNQELLRRRQTFQPQYHPNGHQDYTRRASMLEFSSNIDSDLADFQFDPNPTATQTPVELTFPHKSMDPRKVRSREDLSLDTRFGRVNQGFDMQNVSSYSPAMMSSTAVGMEPSSAYIPSTMDMSMDFDGRTSDVSPMGVQANTMQQTICSTSPIQQNYSLSYPLTNHDPGGGSGSSQAQNQNTKAGQTGPQLTPKFVPKQNQIRRNPTAPRALSISQNVITGSMHSPAQLQQPRSRRQSMEDQSPFSSNVDMTMDQMQRMPTVPGPTNTVFSKFQNAYSSSGFDMLGVLMRVATRPNPEINIGPVDLSCAFVVCDIDKHDLPIVYCSDMFERLTGYTRYEILGRNCRFLQAPDGKVQSGIKRKYVDDQSVLYLKNQITKRAEAQLSLINYRKGGQPFMNLLTMIPITWDTEEYKFFVGFQVDLVEQPNSVSGKNPDGTYAINYNRSAMPAYSLPPPPDPSSGLTDMGQTISRDEVSQVLATIGAGETELSKRIWDKVLLENTDDVVHVLSLKGLFLYLSPASRKVLEYDASELVGTPLSSVCHPSDIVPVTRELKDSSGGAPVNVVYRIRRKHSGYTWFEAHGCLHTEQGKGRKCIILVGRERPVYALDKNEISTDGGIGDSELWTKMSTAGMFLFVSSNSRPMLDQVPDDLVGTSMQSLMRPESRKEFQLILERARAGEKSTFKHDLQNRRGQVLHAQTTVYPGDARKGFKPTFLLAQTRLLKMSRAMLLNQKSSSSTSPQTDQASVGSATPTTALSGQSTNHNLTRTSSTPISAQSQPGENGVITQPGGNALPLGNQDEALASEDNVFDELKTTRSTSWQFELRQMERQNRILAEEWQGLLSRKKKRKRRKGLGQLEKDCANCHTRVTPEWRRGPSGNRDLCNSCGLRWAKQNGRVSPRKYSGHSDKSSTSPAHVSEEQAQDRAGAAKGSTGPTAGSMPAKIEEGDEPPHRDVLPT